jgi:hypothetical protein
MSDGLAKSLGLVSSAEAEARADVERELEAAKLKAAEAHGIPLTMANRIDGTTEEQINLDAQALSKDLMPEDQRRTTEALLLAKKQQRRAEITGRLTSRKGGTDDTPVTPTDPKTYSLSEPDLEPDPEAEKW